MKTFTFEQITEIKDYQFITDSSGFILDHEGNLYQFSGNKVEQIVTPEDFLISDFHFITESHGAIIGNSRVVKDAVQEGAIGDHVFILFLVFAIPLISKLNSLGSRTLKRLSSFIAITIMTISCSNNWQMHKTMDTSSQYVTIITSNQLKNGQHYYPAIKGQASYISITNDNCKSWVTSKVPTNFHLSNVTAIGENFILSSYANSKEGSIPIHGDGDIWIYGNDTTYNKELIKNSPDNPLVIFAQRGIEGLKYFPEHSLIFAFGTETQPAFPKNEVNSTKGNIYQIPVNLKPKYKIIDVPDTVSVQSLSISGSGDLWVTLDNKKPYVSKGTLKYKILDSKRLLRFRNGSWDDIHVKNVNGFEQVEFIPNSNIGYVLTEQGEIFKSLNNGESWEFYNLSGIRKIATIKNSITFLKGKNTLLLLSN